MHNPIQERHLVDPSEIKWNESGLIPVIVQNDETGEVLMLEWMNADALRLTQESGRIHFWNRAQRTIWQPGQGDDLGTQYVEAIWIDCDGDALLITVRPTGPVTSNGQETCFYTELADVLHPHTDEDLPWED
jgi:phosphoribosyl-AMP cyclohydrolase